MGYSDTALHRNNTWIGDTKHKMNKIILCSALLLSLLLLLPSSSGQKSDRSEFVTDLCAKCAYCDTEPIDVDGKKACKGCEKCSECTPKQRKAKEGLCRFCRLKDSVEECKVKCKGGCGICEGGEDKDGLEICKERR